MTRHFRIRVALATAITFSGITSVLAVTLNQAYAAPKIPLIKSSSSATVSEVSKPIDLIRFQQGFITAGYNNDEKSFLAFLDEKGGQVWRINPLQDQQGFITAIAASGNSIFATGISQGAVKNLPLDGASAIPSPAATTPASATPTSTPTPTPGSSATKTIPLVNPDNVVVGKQEIFREDLNNFFVLEINSSGSVISLVNVPNNKLFLPSSIATTNNLKYLVGDEYPSADTKRGALYVINVEGLVTSYSYGEKFTQFTKVIPRSSKSVIVVGSSSDTLAERKVIGKIDAVSLTISTTSGKIEKVMRSSGATKSALRSWDAGTGNLILAGTAQEKKLRESVISSFSPTGSVNWSTRFQNSDGARVAGNCIAVSLLGASKSLSFTPAGAEIFLYTVDAKGKLQKGLRVAKQELISLVTTANKGCALLTYSADAGARVSFL